MVKNKPTEKLSAQDISIENLEKRVNVKKIYIPEKSKETVMIDGSTDEISEKLVDIFKNEIKVLD